MKQKVLIGKRLRSQRRQRQRMERRRKMSAPQPIPQHPAPADVVIPIKIPAANRRRAPLQAREQRERRRPKQRQFHPPPLRARLFLDAIHHHSRYHITQPPANSHAVPEARDPAALFSTCPNISNSPAAVSPSPRTKHRSQPRTPVPSHRSSPTLPPPTSAKHDSRHTQSRPLPRCR